MPEQPNILPAPVVPGPIGVNPVEDVLGGAGPRREVAGCPTGLSDGEQVEVKKGLGTPGTEGATGEQSEQAEPQQ